MNPTGAFLTAEWQDLVMLNYVIEPAVLQPWVPVGTELDFFHGQTFVSVVGFRFLRTRVLGVPIPGHVNFPEVNLRFYVRHGDRRGVVFVRELVPRRLIAWVARVLYGESYLAVPMRERVGVADVRYEWRWDGRWNSVQVTVAGEPADLRAGSEEEFIAEHYWGYTMRGGVTWEYAVEHPRWRVRSAVAARLDCEVAGLFGNQFVPVLRGEPSSAFVAEGSPVIVRRGRPLAHPKEHDENTGDR